MLKYWTAFCMIVCIPFMYAAEIIKTHDFGRIEEESYKLEKDALLLFDVDATLIVPDDAILKPKGKDLFKELIGGYTDRDLFREIRMQAPHSLVDNRSIVLVQRLLEQQVPVIAFTAAPAKIKETTQPGTWRVAELKRFGIDFRSSFPTCDYLELPQSSNQQQCPLYKHGVLYSSLHPKGDILVAFLHHMNFRPSKVIFVDDEIEHVHSVMTCLKREGIECIGIHYTAANELPCALNPEQASYQVEYFIQHDVWLSDEAMRNKIK